MQYLVAFIIISWVAGANIFNMGGLSLTSLALAAIAMSSILLFFMVGLAGLGGPRSSGVYERSNLKEKGETDMLFVIQSQKAQFFIGVAYLVSLIPLIQTYDAAFVIYGGVSVFIIEFWDPKKRFQEIRFERPEDPKKIAFAAKIHSFKEYGLAAFVLISWTSVYLSLVLLLKNYFA